MYSPAVFVIDRISADAAIDTCGLAALVAHGADGRFEATWLPLRRVGDRLVGHVAKPNPIWRCEGAALAMFHGIDGYVSPAWYPSKTEHGRVVPTWNYVAVNVHGTLTAHHETEWKRDVVSLLTDHHEQRIGSDWSITDAPADFIDAMLNGIVGIEITMERVEGKAKLSQNRPPADIDGVIAASSDPLATAVRQANDR